MIKQLLFFLFGIICLTNCNSSTSKNETPTISTKRQFRNVDWEMTKEDVTKNETATLDKVQKDTNALSYSSVNMFNRNFTLGYIFDSLKLKAALYDTQIGLTDDASKICSDIKKSLTEKYGTPFSDTINWHETYINLPPNERDLNQALNIHYAIIHTNWADTNFKPNRIISLHCEQSGLYVHINIGNVNSDWYFRQLEKNNKATKQNL